MNHFIFDGKLYKEGEHVISADSRGLRYGDGLFETMKCISGRLIMADEHFARLWKGMQVLEFDIPKLFTPARLQEEVLSLATKNGHDHISRVRITVSRGDGGLYDAVNHFPHYMIQTWELPLTNGEWNSNGLQIGIYDKVNKSRDILSNLKHNNFLPYVMAALHAKKQKWNDAVVLNCEGRICDSTVANIFLIKDEIVFTPALTEACVAGVLRKHLLQELRSNGMGVIEKEITVEDMLLADEVFLTNSIYNIRWVQRFGDKIYGNDFTRKVYATVIPNINIT